MTALHMFLPTFSPQHSEAVLTLFCHCPSLKPFAPSFLFDLQIILFLQPCFQFKWHKNSQKFENPQSVAQKWSKWLEWKSRMKDDLRWNNMATVIEKWWKVNESNRKLRIKANLHQINRRSDDIEIHDVEWNEGSGRHEAEFLLLLLQLTHIIRLVHLDLQMCMADRPWHTLFQLFTLSFKKWKESEKNIFQDSRLKSDIWAAFTNPSSFGFSLLFSLCAFSTWLFVSFFFRRSCPSAGD